MSRQVTRRGEAFAKKIETEIWQEVPCEDNPYLPGACRCYGYDLFELIEKCRFTDVLYLLFKGDLPSKEESALLEKLMISLINLGPRHPASRAGMLAGASKTNPSHILPIALTILSGTHLGAEEVEEAMRFLQEHRDTCPNVFSTSLVCRSERPAEGDWHPIPGFGSRFGGIDKISDRIARQLGKLPAAGESLKWGTAFSEKAKTLGIGWLPTGLAAAVLVDLGFNSKAGAGFYQILCAPGLLAHGVEFAGKPMTSMPFIRDEEYIIEKE